MITSLTSRQSYAGTGTTGPFGFTFKIFNPATDLRVIKLLVTGDEQPLTYLTDFTVTGIKVGTDAYGGGGNLTTTAPLAVGETLIVRRAPPNVQGLSVQNAGPFFPKSYEDQLDYLTMLLQNAADLVSRSLQLRETADLTTGLSPVLPVPQPTMSIGWDATGKKLINVAAGGRGPAGIGGPIPIVNDTTERDALFPVPAVDNAAIVKSLGYQMRYGLPASGGNKWLSEALTRAGGPVVTAKSKGALGNDSADDYAFFVAVETDIVTSGIHDLDPGIYRIGTDLTLTSFRHIRGGILKPLLGKKISVTGHISAGRHPIFDLSLGGIVDLSACTNSWIFPEWFVDNIRIDLPVPTTYPSGTGTGESLPVLVEQVPPTAGSGVVGHTMQAAYTYFGMPKPSNADFDGGETIPSAPTQWAVTQPQEMFAVEAFARAGFKGAGWGSYQQDVTAGGGFKRMELVPFGEGTDRNRSYKLGFGDCSPANDGGGVLGFPYGAGVAPPGGNTALSATGVAILDPIAEATAAAWPTSAPRVYRKCVIPPNQLYYVKYCFVDESGTEGPLSPAASYNVPNDGKAHCLLLFIREHTPGGACFLHIYVSTTNANAASYRRQGVRYYQGVSGVPSAYQFDYPAGQKSVEIHEYDTTTPQHNSVTNPNWRAATSTDPGAVWGGSRVSCIQQAWDAIQTYNMMGARTIQLAKHYEVYGPLSLYTSLGPMDVGVILRGTGRGVMGGSGGTADGRTSGAGTNVYYLGPAGGTAVIWQCGYSVAEEINFCDTLQDPNNASVGRVKQSLHMVDPWGDTSFWNWIDGCTFRAGGTGGIAFRVDSHSSSASGHTASENTINHTSFYGRDWAKSFTQNQTANFTFKHCLFESSGGTDSEGVGRGTKANSGDIRVTASVHKYEHCTGSGFGQYTYFMSCDTAFRGNGISPSLTVDAWSGEVHTLTCMSFIYLSNFDHFRPSIHLLNSELTSLVASGGSADYQAIYCGSWARIVAPLSIFRNFIVLDNFGATFDCQGGQFPTGDQFRATRRFATNQPQGASDLPARVLVGCDGFQAASGTMTARAPLTGVRGMRPAAIAAGAMGALGPAIYVKGVRKSQLGLLIADSAVQVDYSQPLQNLFVWGEITSDDHVTAFAYNGTGGVITLLPGTCSVTVFKRWLRGIIPMDPADLAAAYVKDIPNRADSAVSLGVADSGQAWTTISGIGGVSSKRIYFPGAGDGFGAKGRIEAAHTDAMVSADFDLSQNVGFGGWLYTSFVDNNNFFGLQLGQDWTYWKVVAGVPSAPLNIQNGRDKLPANFQAKVGVRRLGDYHQILLDGVPIGELQDAALAGTTKFGVGAAAANVFITNFAVTP